MALAEPNGYLRLFVDEGRPMAGLLVEIEGEHRGYARKLYQEINSEAGGASVEAAQHLPDVEAKGLSEREQEVLALLAQGHTNQEIADRLVISLNTVKSHVKHIYITLDVRNRSEATAKALELGLISS